METVKAGHAPEPLKNCKKYIGSYVCRATVPPFAGSFDAGEAEEFYISIRCGLLREAGTKKGWTIRLGCSQVIDPVEKTASCDHLQTLIDSCSRNCEARIQQEP